MQTVQQLLCHGNYFELILSLSRTSCRLSFTTRPPASRRLASPPPPARPPAVLLPLSCRPLFDAARFKIPSKSTLAHDAVAVAAAVLHKHHLIICVGAGLIQIVYWSRSPLVNGGYPSQKCVFAIFAWVFYTVLPTRYRWPPQRVLLRSRRAAALSRTAAQGYDGHSRADNQGSYSVEPEKTKPRAVCIRSSGASRLR